MRISSYIYLRPAKPSSAGLCSIELPGLLLPEPQPKGYGRPRELSVKRPLSGHLRNVRKH